MLNILAENAILALTKAGKCMVRISIEKHPDDQMFSDVGPCVWLQSICVDTSKGDPVGECYFSTDFTVPSLAPGVGGDPEEKNDQQAELASPSEIMDRLIGKGDLDDFFLGEIGPGTDADVRTFPIQVTPLPEWIGRCIDGDFKQENVRQVILARPLGPWAQYYHEVLYVRNLKAGRLYPLVICLPPKTGVMAKE